MANGLHLIAPVNGPNNHITQTCSWLPPAECWNSEFPYGWEEAFDNDGKPYYINHINKTTTFADPRKDWADEAPLPRQVSLTRHPDLGFGFVAGSEKPVIVRFVTEGGPSDDLLLPGDQILAINGEDVKSAPRDHVIKLVRACASVVRLTVCQPPLDNSARRSALLSAAKKAKLKSNPSRVRFAEGVVVNGAPLFPTPGLAASEESAAVLPNVLKVYLENGQTKSFKYDSGTLVRDVVTSLLQKLLIVAEEHFSLVVEHLKTLRRNKLTLLDPYEPVARVAARPGSHSLRCLFRVTFVPRDASQLAQRDIAAFDYLYLQCCNDVVQERYAPELKYDVSLRLAALHIHQHALAHNLAGKLTVKAVERVFGLERFVPVSLMASMKRKELRKLLGHFLKLHTSAVPGYKVLTSFQAKLQYLKIVSELPSYGTKCFATNLRDATMETVLLVSPKFGISQILGIRNSVPIALANIEDMRVLVVRREDELSRIVRIFLQDQELSFSLEDRDAEELILVLQGYYRLLTGEELLVDEEKEPWHQDLAPHYFASHNVTPCSWNYASPSDERPKIANFASSPHYQLPKNKSNGDVSSPVGQEEKCVDRNMNVDISGRVDLGFDVQSVVSMELLQDSNFSDTPNDRQVLRRVAEMEQLVISSQQYLTEQERLPNVPTVYKMPNEEITSHLTHSDSLHLLNQTSSSQDKLADMVKNLKLDVEPSESDTDSNSTPASSPSHRSQNDIRAPSFGLHSPDGLDSAASDIQNYLKVLQDDSSLQLELGDSNLFFDPDIIDLTAIPPPQTPDDDALSVAQAPSFPPTPFADPDREVNIIWGEDSVDSIASNVNDDLDAFLASVQVNEPAPAKEVTPEEILSYIIPPPPADTTPFVSCSHEKIPSYSTLSENSRSVADHPLDGCSQSCAYRNGIEVSENRVRREEILRRSDAALAVLLVRLDQLAARCDATDQEESLFDEQKSQKASVQILETSYELMNLCKVLVSRLMTTPTVSATAELAEVCSDCLQRLRRLSEGCGHLCLHSESPVRKRDLVLRVHDVANAIRQVLHNPDNFGHLAAALTELFRSLRIFQ